MENNNVVVVNRNDFKDLAYDFSKFVVLFEETSHEKHQGWELEMVYGNLWK